MMISLPVTFQSRSLRVWNTSVSCLRNINEYILSRILLKSWKAKKREAARRCTQKRTDLRYGRQTLSPIIKSISHVASEADSFHILAHQFVMPTPTFFHLDADKFRYISGIWLPNSELIQRRRRCLRNSGSDAYATLTRTFYISLRFSLYFFLFNKHCSFNHFYLYSWFLLESENYFSQKSHNTIEYYLTSKT